MENSCKRLSVADRKHNFPRVHFHFNALSFLEEELAAKIESPKCWITDRGSSGDTGQDQELVGTADDYLSWEKNSKLFRIVLSYYLEEAQRSI